VFKRCRGRQTGSYRKGSRAFYLGLGRPPCYRAEGSYAARSTIVPLVSKLCLLLLPLSALWTSSAPQEGPLFSVAQTALWLSSHFNAWGCLLLRPATPMSIDLLLFWVPVGRKRADAYVGTSTLREQAQPAVVRSYGAHPARTLAAAFVSILSGGCPGTASICCFMQHPPNRPSRRSGGHVLPGAHCTAQ
jgi:hypothetical protein